MKGILARHDDYIDWECELGEFLFKLPAAEGDEIPEDALVTEITETSSGTVQPVPARFGTIKYGDLGTKWKITANWSKADVKLINTVDECEFSITKIFTDAFRLAGKTFERRVRSYTIGHILE